MSADDDLHRTLQQRLYGKSLTRASPLSASSPMAAHSTTQHNVSNPVKGFEPSLVPKTTNLLSSTCSMKKSKSLQALKATKQAVRNQRPSLSALSAAPESLVSPFFVTEHSSSALQTEASLHSSKHLARTTLAVPTHSRSRLDLLNSSQSQLFSSSIGLKSESIRLKKSRNTAQPAELELGLDDMSATNPPTSFIESLHLTNEMHQELETGNFLYLRHAPRGDRSAYNLSACQHWEVSTENYYTLSKSGVTHFVGTESEFTPLARWEREFKLYQKIRRIRFFQQYRIWKSFLVWKKSIRQTKSRTSASCLTTSLFILHPTLKSAILRLKRLCAEVSSWRLFEVEKGKTYELEAFCQQQTTLRNNVAAWLTEFADDIRALVRGACDEVLDKFLIDNSIQADHKMTFMERAALRTECSKLTQFIRLCDFLMRDTLLDLALDSTECLKSILLPMERPERVIRTHEDPPAQQITFGFNETPKPAPLFRIVAEFERGTSESKLSEDDVNLAVKPSESDFQGRVKDLLLDAMTAISSASRLLTHSDLSPYTQAASDESDENGADEVDLTQLALAHPKFSKLSDEISMGLSEIFNEVQAYCEVFQPYRATFLANAGDMQSFEDQFADIDLEEFEQSISKYRGQVTEFDTIPRSADIATMRVDSAALKLYLLPSPERCLHALKDLFPILMRSRADKLLSELNERNSVLTSQPTDVEPFVAKVSMLEQVQREMPEFKDRFDFIGRMAKIMRDNAWEIPPELNATFSLLKAAMEDIEAAAQNAEASLDDDTKRFASDVEAKIPPLRKQFLRAREKLDDPAFGDPTQPEAQVLLQLRDLEQHVTDLINTSEKYQHYQSMLKQPQAEFEIIEEITDDLKMKLKLWQAVADWKDLTEGWKAAEFDTIDAEQIGTVVAQFNKVAVQSGRLLPGNKVAPMLRSMVEDFKQLLPVVVDLRSKSLKPRHWDEIEQIIHHQFDKEHSYTLGELLELNVMDHQPEIAVVATKAVQEAVLEDMLSKKVLSVWKDLEFQLNPYKDSKDVFILGSLEDIVAGLDESLVTLNTILGSRYCAPIREEVESWQAKLMLLSDNLDEWMLCQKQWMYLETIFSADDIKRQLPDESKSFAKVDKGWKIIMKRTNDNPLAIHAGTWAQLKGKLQDYNQMLDKIQKSLEDYLETKRSAFPRFYFLSNEELLEILAQTRDPQAVQPHLRKCFDAMARLEFGKEAGSNEIFAMISGEGERVEFHKKQMARGNVEDWLMAVQETMCATLQKLMKDGVEDYDQTARKDWVLKHPGQIVATVAQIMWSYHTEKALLSDDPPTAMDEWYRRNVAQLGDLTLLVRGNLTKLERKVIVALVTTDVHARDIVERLRDEKVDSIGNFDWQQQLRYYWENDDCIVRQSNSMIRYGYEYQGCTSRLVITPLTDRCWMTITGAVHLKLGAAPAGPAGTGKTESSKDLAKALAIQCIVFNCSDQIDYQMMGKLFSGLAQASAWTCLDEFNRIDIEVLSVVAQQLQQLRQGILQGLTDMEFEGRHIRLRQHCVIITMNPGYAGRTELPDNLKILFRPVAMMVPDYGLIAEIILFAEDFDDAKNLSRKMTKLYKLSSEQLSQQRHYDFGMRAVKSVLVMAGALKRSNPGLSEDVVLIRAMRDSNVPKFLSPDLPLFHAIVGDLFPGVVVPHNETGELQEAIEQKINDFGLQQVETFKEKIIQLYETFNVRFGVVITGPTGAGKSTCYRTLAAAMTLLRENGSANEAFQTVHSTVLNPKCITMGELYGEFNELTQEWHDGLASTIIRSAVADETEDKKWTVFDGPIDALWIENMNTVLDDNMTLCLANGERIKLKPQMRMLFEVQDLEVASPATVSRLGVVYMTPDDLGWLPYVQSWLPRDLPESMSDELRDRVLQLFQDSFDDGLRFQREQCTEPVRTVVVQLATSLCNLFTALLLSSSLDFSAPAEQLMPFIDALYAFSYTWALGGSIIGDHFEAFDGFVKSNPCFSFLRLGNQSVYDVFPEFKDNIVTWRKWEDVVPQFEYKSELPYFQLVVPTKDTVRFTYLLDAHASQLNSVFFTGVTGTGKTVIVSDWLNSVSSSTYTKGKVVQPILINFSAQTASIETQLLIENKLEKKKKTLFGAPTGKRVVIFVDDVNMPAVEEYGAQPPIELLRQFQDFKGFYDRDKLFWKDVVDSVIITSAAPPGGGRSEVTPRFSRHFHVLCVPPATDDLLRHIFGSILTGFLSAQKFPEDVKSLSTNAVDATIEVYNSIRSAMKPTPSKSHYTFNLRDVSKVFQGILMIGAKECAHADTFIRLWAHESMRVFYDRLINIEDKNWFTQNMIGLLTRHFGRSGNQWNHEALFENSPILFVDFLRPRVDDSPSTYEEALDMQKLAAILNDALEDYNLTNPNQMKLVFFTDAIRHVARISRILRQPRGNAMLVGVGGSGKQSLTRMACAMADIKCVQIELTRGYGLAEFREDIKTMMFTAGAEGKQVAFLFTDTQIVDERFLEDVNNVLNTGEVPGLMENDDINKIADAVRPEAQRLGIPETRDNLYRLFVSRVRDNLHIMLAMSPVGDSLRIRCRQFPSLINCCTIDWFMPWPRDALLSVAQRFLGEEELGSDEVKAAVAEACVVIHKSVSQYADQFYEELQRKVYTTPKSYLDLIQLYLSMLKEKREQVGTLRHRLAVGVNKLEETNEMVAGLQEELTALQPVLEVKAKETAELLERVKVDQAEADKIKAKVQTEEKTVRAQAEEVAAVQADAQRDLDVAMPALNNAIKALDSLSKKDITEVKSFAKPPPAVQTVMEAVCILLAEKPDWDTAKKVLSNTTFMQDLKEFDKDNIPAAALKKIKKYVEDPDFAVEKVGKVSLAAKSLCMWVHAMDVYSKVAKEVEPKRQRLAELNAQLQAANDALKEKQDQLQSVLDKVAILRQQCDDTVAEKERLANEAELTQNRLKRAEQLTNGLADEQVRWKASVSDYDAALEALVGDVLLAAASISYYGPFTGVYRQRIVAHWLEHCRGAAIPCSERYSLMSTMGDPVQVQDWQINGLPTDSVSTNNAILVTRAKRWPLMIDPQEQAKKWVKNMEKQNGLETSRLTNPNMLRTLENCIRLGKPLLLEDIGEYLDPALEPVLARAVFKQSGRLLIHLGDSDIDYDPNFRLYLSTKMPNPHYLPEVCIKVTVINFTVTMDGLEDQLLGAVVKKERPDIEDKKNRLVVSMANDKKQLQDLEDKILKLLSESTGNILDDVELIRVLGESKQVSEIISQRLQESEKTEEEINEMRNKYRPVAVRGSLIYFVIADLARIDPMYQFSLAYFTRLYNMCIDDSEKSDDLDIRLSNLLQYQTQTVYENVCRGLFESHKLIFSFLICIQILRQRGEVKEGEWSLLLRGAGMVVNDVSNPFADVVAELGWNLLAALEQNLPDSFSGLVDHICKNQSEWKDWAASAEPHETPMPSPWTESLNMMQKMLVLKAFREEKVMFAVKEFVVHKLGKPFVESPPVSMADIHADTDCFTPVVFILSVGADPTGMLLSFARNKQYSDRLRLISLGQGQGKRAEELINYSMETGDWVLLQNCHLAKSWMPSLEKIVEEFTDSAAAVAVGAKPSKRVHKDFRLFLTSMPATYFPVPVLQNGVKLTNEPPKGIRANLSRSLANIPSWTDFEVCEGSFSDDASPKVFAWKKLAFGLCFFHAIIQERRKFGPLGWNILYEFNDSDLETSIQVLKMFLEEQPVIPWDALRYVTGHINYGGRVTDDWDRRCLMSILHRFYSNPILDDTYKFSESGTYYAPSAGELQAYKQYVSSLPLNDRPEIFGMHENANISFQQRETDQILKTCLSIQPRSSGGGTVKTPDEIASEVALDVEQHLPPVLSMDEAGKETFVYKGDHMDSLATVLSQEMVRFNKLLKVMRASLSDLQKAIRGEVLMSDELDLMYTALINNQVPSNWEAAAYPSLKPLASWVKDLHARIEFMRDWLRHGQPDVFWMSGFFFPQGFMTGTLQNHARKYAIPIDTLSFSFKVLDKEVPSDVQGDDVPEDGVLINGLFMDGARWNREARIIDDPNPGEMFATMPIIHFMPTRDYKPSPKEYSAPIYKTSVRAGVLSTTGMSTNFIVAVELPTTVDPSVWVLRGAALLCQLND